MRGAYRMVSISSGNVYETPDPPIHTVRRCHGTHAFHNKPAIKTDVENIFRSGGHPYGPSSIAETVHTPLLEACSLNLPVKPSLPLIINTTSFSFPLSVPSTLSGMLAIVNGCASVGRELTVGKMTYACCPGFHEMLRHMVRRMVSLERSSTVASQEGWEKPYQTRPFQATRTRRAERSTAQRMRAGQI